MAQRHGIAVARERNAAVSPPARSAERVAVIGAGYVGLTTAACLAHLGHPVCCGDVDAAKVARLRRGEVTILEKGLPELVATGLDSGRLCFELGAGAAADEAAVAFLCVPTPRRPDGGADLSAMVAAAEEMGPVLARDAVVVNKSTAPAGSTCAVATALGRADIAVVANPEFLREGHAVADFLHPDRVVVGGSDLASARRVADLYASLAAPVVVTDAASAETIKYATNAFLATKLSFANELADLCEATGANVVDVLVGVGLDPRVGAGYLDPGPAWGGSCLPKDASALLYLAERAGADLAVLRAAVTSNERRPARIAARVRAAAGGSLDGVRIGVWGLTFKAGTSDRRSSPALAICRRLLAAGATVHAYDPAVRSAIVELGTLAVVSDPYEACKDAAVLAVLTEWSELRELDFAKVQELMASPRIVDARNLLDPAPLRESGFAYVGVGGV